MKRENIEQRIKNFFADLEEPERSELIKSTIKCLIIIVHIC